MGKDSTPRTLRKQREERRALLERNFRAKLDNLFEEARADGFKNLEVASVILRYGVTSVLLSGADPDLIDEAIRDAQAMTTEPPEDDCAD